MQVVLEPTATGWRASTGAPLEVSVEAATEAAALDAMVAELERRISAGARVVEINFQVATNDPLRRFAGDLEKEPLHSEWAAEVQAYRKQREHESAAP